MDATPETTADSVLAEFAAGICRRMAEGLLEHTGGELRSFLSAESARLQAALADPATLEPAEQPHDPPRFSRKGHVVINTNPVTSHRNVLAPLLTEKLEDDRAVATVGPLPRQYQGPRGMLHGGYVGVLLDQVLWDVVFHRLGHASFTRTLNLTYESPVPLGEELTVEGRVTKIDGRKTFAEGELRSGDTVCARAEGLWVSPR
ncbi:PaaI family thioesterase [Amycolatopsis acidicola]|uniref:Acyl-coenzyme A thioesterase THEM4 n=1 Tax=Amycolatopsis acidicola TaxID=2596893 RepID=A0A5N0VED2_9PSEU|nr:PaaI family thioesterase [Amycolatopsis acidicola]KAA9164425.1 PaaI family thioesterase [Amycolatopsis acidicola]